MISGMLRLHAHLSHPSHVWAKACTPADLTKHGFSADALRQFLADPPKALRARGSQNYMPNLELKPKEIASLVAFINQDGGTAGM